MFGLEVVSRDVFILLSIMQCNYITTPAFTFPLFLASPFSMAKSCVQRQHNTQLLAFSFIKSFQKLPHLLLILLYKYYLYLLFNEHTLYDKSTAGLECSHLVHFMGIVWLQGELGLVRIQIKKGCCLLV